MENFIISCESTVDIPYSIISKRKIPILFYSYIIDGKPYIDDMQRNPNALSSFYKAIADGKIPSTSQINQAIYEDFFERNIESGDILHIAFGTGMTNSYYNAKQAAEEITKRHPDRKIIVIDSLCSSSGYGMLVNYAADMKDFGKSMVEIASWITDNRQNIHHQFFSTRLDFYRRSGRMSGPVATIATLLGICPIMRLDDAGKIIAYDKVRGKQNAVKRTIEMMEAHAVGGKQYIGKCYICHSDCLKEAQKLQFAITENFPGLTEDDIKIYDIGTIIASHCGPGTVAVFFLGDKRTPLK